MTESREEINVEVWLKKKRMKIVSASTWDLSKMYIMSTANVLNRTSVLSLHYLNIFREHLSFCCCSRGILCLCEHINSCIQPRRKQEELGSSSGLFFSVRGLQTDTYFPAKGWQEVHRLHHRKALEVNYFISVLHELNSVAHGWNRCQFLNNWLHFSGSAGLEHINIL